MFRARVRSVKRCPQAGRSVRDVGNRLGLRPCTPYPVPMEATPQNPPTPPLSHETNLERALEAVAAGRSLLSERLLVVGRGPSSVPGGTTSAVGVAANGDLVLIVTAGRLPAEAPAAIADRLDRLAALGESNLQALNDKPFSREELARRHQEFFPTVAPPATFNRAQRVFLLVRELPSVDVWKALVIELGKMLGGVWRVVGAEVIPVQPPADLLRKRSGEDERFPWATALGAIVVLAGVGLGTLALTRADPPQAAGPGQVVEPPIRDVAFGVSPDATHSQWIGQQRLLRTTDGRLVALYPGAEGLNIVTDQSNQGRSWRSPKAYPEISPLSMSSAIDADDNIHVAFADESGISYALLRSDGRGWAAPVVVSLDDTATSPVVDIGWDPAGSHAYAVWAADTDAGEVPRWAAVSAEDEPSVIHDGRLADPGDEVSVLVNIEVGLDSTIHATFRRGDSSAGWFGLSGTIQPDGGVDWAPEERLPSDEGFGAGALAVDQTGVAHLILRDSTSYQLLYFRRTQRGGWSSPQTAVDADSIEEIDMPVLSVDTSSRLIYLFFQTNEFDPAGEVSLAVRDPAGGWEGPYRIAQPSGGAGFPTGMAVTAGQPIVLWTKGGDNPSIQAARVIAP